MSGHPLRLCDACGQVDDAPRHVHGLSADDNRPSQEFRTRVLDSLRDNPDKTAVAIDGLMDTSTSTRHLDCCAGVGCPDGTCNVILATADGAQNEKLRKILTSGRHDTVGAERTAFHAQQYSLRER